MLASAIAPGKRDVLTPLRPQGRHIQRLLI